MQVSVLNGVNLNMLGRRDPEQYGSLTLSQLETQIYSWASDLTLNARCFSTNHEGAYVELIHDACDSADGLVVNPGAWTHYSYAIRDALEIFSGPVVEVHLSAIEQREEWRRSLGGRRRRLPSHQRAGRRRLPPGPRISDGARGMSHADRLRRLGDELERRGVDAMLVPNPTNIRYLTGFSGSNALVIVRPGDAVFLTDFRYLERVGRCAEFIEVSRSTRRSWRRPPSSWADAAPGATAAASRRDHLSLDRHQALAAELAAGLDLDAAGRVERLRVVKDDDELAAIRRAAALLEPVYAALAGRRAGWPHRARRGLADPRAVPRARAPTAPRSTRSSPPHERGRAAARRARGRCDPARTPWSRSTSAACSTATARTAPAPSPPATPPHELAEAYAIVPARRSRPASTPSARAPPAREVDAIARDIITEAGHGEHFGTARPRCRPRHPRGAAALDRSDATLEPGMVVTVEPGIYLPGVGGVRIEDLVIVTADGAERLTGYPKELITTG